MFAIAGRTLARPQTRWKRVVIYSIIRIESTFASAEQWLEPKVKNSPRTRWIITSGLLLVSLVAIVGLAKALTPTVELGVARLACQKRL